MSKTKVSQNNRISEALGEIESNNVPASMKPEIMVFNIVGISPLLQNNPEKFIGVAESGALATKKEYKDEEEAKLRLYLDPDGNYCHPCGAFTKSMVKAVAGKKFGKQFATNVIKGGVFITEPFAILSDEEWNPLKTYTIHKTPVIVGKSRVLRCRPMWTNWRIKVAFEVDTAIMQRHAVVESLALAGRIIGIGDFRPEKGGGFGRFNVE